MTAARQERKSRHCNVILMAVCGSLAILCADFSLASGLLNERVVVNRYTGLAIDGFDPVAYFIDGVASVGRPELELRAAGAAWRFRNEGNREAFSANPEVYQPRFGGHDPVALARGAATAGNPTLWLITEHRLYLFYSEATRDSFEADPDRAIAAAERNWRAVRETLLP